jgi:hypothetical protein
MSTAFVLVAALAAAPSIQVQLVEARTHLDSHWYGEKAFLFRMAGLKAQELDGKKIVWTLEVKRKLAEWSTAKRWAVSEQTVYGNVVNDVAYALTYRNLAKAKFQPGEHVAAFVGRVEGVDVFRTEIRFVLPALGPNAYDPRAYRR